MGSVGDTVFLLDQYPCRNVEICGWISSLSYEAAYKEDPESNIKMHITRKSFFQEKSSSVSFEWRKVPKSLHLLFRLPFRIRIVFGVCDLNEISG